MTLRPSALPALAISPCYEPSGEDPTGIAASGTVRHAKFNIKLQQSADPSIVDPSEDLHSDEEEAVQWAVDYVKLHARTLDHPMHLERTMTLLDAEFGQIMQGTPDVVCGPDLFDLKWAKDDYEEQMNAYALMMMQLNADLPEVRVHLLYAAFKKVEVYTITQAEAIGRMNTLLERIVNDAAQKIFTPSKCCLRCAKNLVCPAAIKAVDTIAKGYAEMNLVQSWHPSRMTTAEEVGIALTICRQVIKPWMESMEHHALEFVVRRGLALPGFDLKSRAGKSWITDVPIAFVAARMPQEEFLSCCDVRFNTSKTYTDKLGLFDTYAKFHGTKKAVAKRELTKRLQEADAIATGKSTQYLSIVKDKSDTNSNLEEE